MNSHGRRYSLRVARKYHGRGVRTLVYRPRFGHIRRETVEIVRNLQMCKYKVQRHGRIHRVFLQIVGAFVRIPQLIMKS